MAKSSSLPSAKATATATATSEISPILGVFSDVDGTLVHEAVSSDGIVPMNIIQLPPSKTGKVSQISKRTLQMVKELRARKAFFIMISGMRHSTFQDRRHCLPVADAYVIENGGRIFYPKKGDSAVVEEQAKKKVKTTQVNDLATADNCELEEDVAWRKLIESRPEEDGQPPEKRTGVLWDLYRKIISKGWVVDTSSYSTMFRVNTGGANAEKGCSAEVIVEGLDTSLRSATNFGLVDVFPAGSGKDMACKYLASHFNVPLSACAALCDDDNDIDMAALCGAGAFVTGITSASMQVAIDKDPNHFRVSSLAGVLATEEMLELILSRVDKGDNTADTGADTTNPMTGIGSSDKPAQSNSSKSSVLAEETVPETATA